MSTDVKRGTKGAVYRGKIKQIHFIGIGGSGMNGIAEVLINMGYKVTGSDLSDTDVTRRLRSLGAAIFTGHKEENVSGSQCVVYSSAVKKDNPELKEARARLIPAIPRAEMLAELMRMKYGIAIAGTHGKTTTTSMVSMILAAANLDPTIVTGGKLNSLGANAKLGGGAFLVAEADESDGSFLKLSPTIAVVTNIDREHMDHYADMEAVKAAFLDFINKVPFYGCAVICLDHPVLQSLIPRITRRILTYGMTAQADVHARAIKYDGMQTLFEVWHNSVRLGGITLNLPGEHNVYNTLAAVSVCRELDIPFSAIKAGITGFTGVERRFQMRGDAAGILVVDDYGHHPEEIKAVLCAAKKGWDRRLVVAFQPHRFTRTQDLFEGFLSAFNDADMLVLTEVYAAGEEKIEGASGEALYKGIRAYGHKDVSFVPDVKDLALFLGDRLMAGDMLITLGAGDVWKAGVALVDILKTRKQ